MICARGESCGYLFQRVKEMAAAAVGRPTVMTPDVKDLVLEALERGLPVRKACRSVGIDPEGFYLALSRDPDFNERYERAKAAAVDAIIHDADDEAEKTLSAENGTQVAAAKVFIDHKWRMASRIAPQKWGEKANINVTTAISDDPQELAKRLAFLQALNGNGPGDDAEPAGDDEESLV
jgi:hypothetical protein